MGTPEPILPSFELVLSQPSYTLRLPAYRVSHMLRYHPYPRYGNSRPRMDPHMFTIDERNEVEEHHERVDLSIPAASLDNPQEQAVAIALHQALNGPGDAEINIRRRLSPLVVDLALYIIRKLGRAQQASGEVQPNVEFEDTAK